MAEPTTVLHRWRFNEGTGLSVADSGSATPNNGTITGSPAWVVGREGAFALNFTQSDLQYVTISFVDLGTDHTVSVWYKKTASGDGILLGGGSGDYAFYIDDTDWYYSPNSSHFVSVPHGGLSDALHLLTVTRTGATVKFYKDGAQLGTTQTLVDAAEALTVESIGAYSDHTFPIKGIVDDLLWYARALSGAEVLDLYNNYLVKIYATAYAGTPTSAAVSDVTPYILSYPQVASRYVFHGRDRIRFRGFVLRTRVPKLSSAIYGPRVVRPVKVINSGYRPPRVREVRNRVFPTSHVWRLPPPETGNLLVAPLNLTESVGDHFLSRGWATVQDQINAGYPLVGQPVPQYGNYDEIVDFEGVFNNVIVNVDWATAIVSGTVQITCELSHSVDRITWSTPVITSSMFIQTFRYLKMHITFEAVN